MPLRTIHLLRLGEETAQLGPMALRAAEIHEEQTRLGVQRLVALLVPGDHHRHGRGDRRDRVIAAAGDAEPERSGADDAVGRPGFTLLEMLVVLVSWASWAAWCWRAGRAGAPG